MDPKELEDRFYSIGKRIASFDYLRDDISVINESLKEIVSSILAVKEQHSQEIKSILIEIDELKDRLKSESRVSDNLRLDLRNAEDEQDLLVKKVQSLEEAKEISTNLICSLRDSVRDIKKSLEEIMYVQTDLSKYASVAKSGLDLHLEKIQALKQDSLLLTSKVSQIPGILEKQASDRIEFSNLLKSTRELCTKSFNELSKKTDQIADVCKRSLEEKISSIKIPAVDHLASKNELEKVSSSLDVLNLDVKNSVLKSNNNEMQNNLNSKKIENILLTQKNIELARG